MSYIRRSSEFAAINKMLKATHAVNVDIDRMIDPATGMFIKEKARVYGTHPVMVFTNLIGAVSNVLSSASVAVNDNKWIIPSNLWTMNVAMKVETATLMMKERLKGSSIILQLKL
ncbi:uncharacterized protein LOC111715433 isoform X2 [Eurytemora carolleeae]|uniref:uncharacterized protein LOC111715433 isoform X2 n=1 Tax=Eurytemora carolleeae TaxID=1294199 RepID=UPI000C769BB7|nr:uncharacterized protein LOC111715433 isoform X2 [Eurytemora carolleeae]|eukprot:XP_023346523.1 uncharacterized protein LOC111715433 isoform X2 [Eurytemora affinis]